MSSDDTLPLVVDASHMRDEYGYFSSYADPAGVSTVNVNLRPTATGAVHNGENFTNTIVVPVNMMYADQPYHIEYVFTVTVNYIVGTPPSTAIWKTPQGFYSSVTGPYQHYGYPTYW